MGTGGCGARRIGGRPGPAPQGSRLDGGGFRTGAGALWARGVWRMARRSMGARVHPAWCLHGWDYILINNVIDEMFFFVWLILEWCYKGPWEHLRM